MATCKVPGTVTVASVAATYPTNPQVILEDSARSIKIVNLATASTDAVTISWDGVNDIDVLWPGVEVGAIYGGRSGRGIWLKGVNAPSVKITVE
jgi:hypothetical protein